MLDLSPYLHLVSVPEDHDRVVIFARRHWASFLGQFAFNVFILILPLIIYFVINISSTALFSGNMLNIIVIAASIYYLIVINIIFVSWVTFYYDVYILTTRGIIDITQDGLWGRKISQLSLLQVQDVSSKINGIVQTIFNYGDVVVLTAAEVPNFNLQAIPDPQAFSDKVMELHNQLKRRKNGQNNGEVKL